MFVVVSDAREDQNTFLHAKVAKVPSLRTRSELGHNLWTIVLGSNVWPRQVHAESFPDEPSCSYSHQSIATL